MAQKILKVGSSAGMTISKGALETLGLRVGDEIEIQESKTTRTVTIFPKGTLAPADVEIMKIGADILRRYEDDFRSLANR